MRATQDVPAKAGCPSPDAVPGSPADWSIVTRAVKHAVIPAIAPALIVGLYWTPVSLVGCLNRGIAAFAIVIASLVVALVAAVRALRASRRHDPDSLWWILSAVILAVPAILVLGPLG